MKKILLFIEYILFLNQLCAQSHSETFFWVLYSGSQDTIRKIERAYVNDSTFMEIGVFHNPDTAWFEIRNGKWFMKNHEKDSFALFFDTSYIDDTTAASWKYDTNQYISYCWQKENRSYNGYPIYRLFYWDVRYDPPRVSRFELKDGTIREHVCMSSQYVHPPIYYFFTYKLGIFGLDNNDLTEIRQGIDISLRYHSVKIDKSKINR